MRRDYHMPMRAALLLSIVLFAINSRQWIAAGALLLFWLVGLTSLRITADRTAQLALVLVAVTASWLLSGALALPINPRMITVLGPVGQVMSLALLLAATTRLLVREPWGGARPTAALVVIALLFLADGQFDLSFITLSMLTLACLWRALWAAEPARTGFRAMDRRLRILTGVTQVIAIVIASGVALAIPIIYPKIAGLVLRMVDTTPVSTGFGTTMTLGELSGLRDNDARVLRVHGKVAPHLRGIAYDEYRYGRWVQSKEESLRAVSLAPDTTPYTTEVETVGGDLERFFVPLDAADVSMTTSAARADDTGNLLAAPETKAERIRFRLAPRDRLTPAAPRATDLQVSEVHAQLFHSLATEWTRGMTGSAARVAALTEHLRQHYEYALSFERNKKLDPVVDFLTVHRRGHCEYFASALALLARSIGIPARVIGGYRVSERNDLGGYYVVREQHAHAWVEAWHEGAGWRTYDPTPASGLPSAHTPALAGVFDYLGHLVSSLVHGVTTRDLYVLAAVLLAAWLLVRFIQAARNRKATAAARDLGRVVPPALIELLRLLEQEGRAREMHEPLERYAMRLAEEAPLAPVAAVLRSYTAHRYGDHGSSDQLDAQLQLAARTLHER